VRLLGTTKNSQKSVKWNWLVDFDCKLRRRE
jgi:hypothetical protein